MQTNANITVYNKYYDKLTRLDKWKRTQLDGQVFWDSVKATNVVKGGMDNADSAYIYIPLLSAGGYVPPKEFKANQNGWTLKSGDRVVKGLIDLDVTNITELEKQYDDVVTITSVDPKLYGSMNMQHYQVGGR